MIIEMLMSDRAAASAGVAAICPPRPHSASRLMASRSQPITAKPALMRFDAIGRPMRPRPMKAIVFMSLILFRSRQLALAASVRLAHRAELDLREQRQFVID